MQGFFEAETTRIIRDIEVRGVAWMINHFSPLAQSLGNAKNLFALKSQALAYPKKRKKTSLSY